MNNVILWVLIYVDNLTIPRNSTTSIGDFKAYPWTCFNMENLGVIKYILGLERMHSSAEICLCQLNYCTNIMVEAGMFSYKPA